MGAWMSFNTAARGCELGLGFDARPELVLTFGARGAFMMSRQHVQGNVLISRPVAVEPAKAGGLARGIIHRLPGTGVLRVTIMICTSAQRS